MSRIFHFLCVAFLSIMPVYAGAVSRPVVIDIGHQYTASGAESPDGKINEYAFWAQYAIEVRREVEAAGYPCIITNRSEAPTKEPLATYNKESGVVHLNKPDKDAKRYPSTHHPEHIGAGMISADYAIDKNALCVVFLHLNSVGSKWSVTPPTGLIICNKNHGNALAESVCEAMRADILDQKGGMPNAKKGIKVLPRHIGSQSGAGWMNTLDEEKIPAIIFEAVYVNNRGHIDFISKDANARKLARTIGKGVVNWLKANHPIKVAPPAPAEPVRNYTLDVYPQAPVTPGSYLQEIMGERAPSYLQLGIRHCSPE
ncbi:MAG: hypothetical protein E7030_09200 [Akkermansiaceae bacterium]|nr:hypothetical protein [Akkermansiaceae bacterium]